MWPAYCSSPWVSENIGGGEKRSEYEGRNSLGKVRKCEVAGLSPRCGPCVSAARCILFLIIWLVTGGRHHFWLLPNLTADVGFIDSFRPLYTHDYKGPRASGKKGSEKDGSASGKAQRSDSDKSDSEKKDGDEEEEDEEEEESKDAATDRLKEAEGEGTDRHSDSDSDRREDDGSQHSNGNDFEMITREELEQHTEEEEEEDDDEETQDRKEEGGSESKGQTAES